MQIISAGKINSPSPCASIKDTLPFAGIWWATRPRNDEASLQGVVDVDRRAGVGPGVDSASTAHRSIPTNDSVYTAVFTAGASALEACGAQRVRSSLKNEPQEAHAEGQSCVRVQVRDTGQSRFTSRQICSSNVDRFRAACPCLTTKDIQGL